MATMPLNHHAVCATFLMFTENIVSYREQRGHGSAASFSVYQNENGGNFTGDEPLLTTLAKTFLDNA